ncbi:hypothetical protein FVR03_09590 [Pontibacter qinzhouensis]|uniref:Uncharacterized protein n=1 Tax=Pontibacter qinzhouensis TaxID=2603253 RepID=A0A5C8K9I3_9BACT|nr:hypothetical protein [Pontibacter qinzhouensis]TXK47439.1 hypothetical protein FVR03_09590 [Pontibacter qinzhouensis]
MSWDIVLFNSKQKIETVEELDEELLEPIDFNSLLEESFAGVEKDGKHIELIGNDFSLEYFTDEETASNLMMSINGENGLYVLIELAKEHGWQMFDTALGEMIDLENPEKNGYKNHQAYVQQILKK